MNSRPLHLMMIDDDQNDAALFQALFTQTAPDFLFETVDSAEEALALLNTPGRALPDMILLDLKMPGMDGHECLATIKANPELKHLTVMMVSNSSDEKDVQRAYYGLASAYLMKPAGEEDGLKMMDALQGFWRHAQLPRPRS